MKFVRYVSCDNVLHEFGARIAALRLAQNLSRAEVAGAAGISLRRLARFESGAASLDLIGFVRLCLVLGLRDRITNWVPELPAETVGRTLRGARIRKRASKRTEPDPDPYDEPEAYWAKVRWIWEP